MKLNVTFELLRNRGACYSGYNKLHNYMYGVNGDINPFGYNQNVELDTKLISLKTILESNGTGDAIWCLRYIPHKSQVKYEQALLSLLPLYLDFFDDFADVQTKTVINDFRKYVNGDIDFKSLRSSVIDYEKLDSLFSHDENDESQKKSRYLQILSSLLGVHSCVCYDTSDKIASIVDELYNAMCEFDYLKLDTKTLVMNIINHLEKL